MIKKGILGGTGAVLLANINSSDLLKTAVLAAVGSLVSALVSIAIKKWLIKEKHPPS